MNTSGFWRRFVERPAVRRGGWWLSCALLLLATAASAAEMGGIRGSVSDKEFEVPLGKVQVTVVEATRVTQTSEDGFFTIEGVVPGKYTVLFGKDGFLRQAAEVTVPAGGFTEVRMELPGEVTEMEEFVVRGLELGGGTELGLLQVRQDATGLQDAIGADLIRRAGASNVGAALKLVVGTSVQDGKYVVIRGLADRYTQTTLNQVRLPTADHEKRAVQLDQFPSAQVESVNVYKSFTPDQQGDATGGTVEIKTRSLPATPFLTLSSGVSYNTMASGRDDFLSYKGGGAPFWAMDDGRRALPVRANDQAVPTYTGAVLTPTPAQLENAQRLDQITKLFQPVAGPSEKTVGPDYSWALSGGMPFQWGGDKKLGFLAGFSYGQKYNYYDDGVRNSLQLTPGETNYILNSSFVDRRGTDEVQWSASFGLGFDLNEHHSLGLTFVHNQTATDQARILEDRGNPAAYDVATSLRYNERAFQSIQLRGEHEWAEAHGIRLDWTLARSISAQDEPDMRLFRTLYFPDTQRSQLAGNKLNGSVRIWREIEETSDQGQFHVTLPFTQWTGNKGFIKLGPFLDQTKRDFQIDSFTYVFASQFSSALAYRDNPARVANNALGSYVGPGRITDVFLHPGRTGLATNNPPSANQLLWFVEPTRGDADYRGDQQILAGYIMTEVPINSWLKVTGGVRVEQTELKVDITSPTGNLDIIQGPDAGGNYGLLNVPDELAGSQLKQIDLLPAAAINWQIVPRLNLRLSWSQTIARPTFRELAPVRLYEFIGGDQFTGNPALRISQSQNYDARLEWFPRAGDVVAISAFYKEVTDPIEYIAFDVSGGNTVNRPVNYPTGKVTGLEFELRHRLSQKWELLKDFTVGFNATLIQSEVVLTPEEQQQMIGGGINTVSRPMLGQPEYLLNANLIYDNTKSGTAVGVFYNKSGKKLVVGESLTSSFNPSVYEQPSDSLDLSIEQKIGKHWKITFRAKNLTDPLLEQAYEPQWLSTPITKSSYRKGRDFSLSASCSW